MRINFSVLVFPIILVLSFSAGAVGSVEFQTNMNRPHMTPQSRVCVQLGGQIGDAGVTYSDGNDDKLPTCIFGSAIIGSQALFDYKTTGTVDQSLAAYFQTKTQSVNCDSSHNCQILKGQDTDGVMRSMDYFSDSSVIETNTLHRGYNNSANQRLNQALENKTEEFLFSPQI